jgi:hypothetical protein
MLTSCLASTASPPVRVTGGNLMTPLALRTNARSRLCLSTTGVSSTSTRPRNSLVEVSVSLGDSVPRLQSAACLSMYHNCQRRSLVHVLAREDKNFGGRYETERIECAAVGASILTDNNKNNNSIRYGILYV